MKFRVRLIGASVGLSVLALLLLVLLIGVLEWRAELRAVEVEVSTQADTLLLAAQRASGILPTETPELLLNASGASSARVYEAGQQVWTGRVRQPFPLDDTFLATTETQAVVRRGDTITASRRSGTLVVQVAQSLAPARRTLERYILIAGVVGTLLSVLAGSVIAIAMDHLLDPLEQLARRVQVLDSPGPVPGLGRPDEIGNLARALNVSMEGLRDRHAAERLFLANASHELRTPVAAMIAEVEHTLSRLRSPEEDRASLVRLQGVAFRLRDLTGNLLTLNGAQRRLAHPHQVDLLDLAGDVVDRFQPLAIDKELDLHLSGAPSPAAVDPMLVSRLIENLISNALKFTDYGEVHVTVAPAGRNIEVQVEDTGPGMPDNPSELYEPFRRGDTGQEGYGLGLAVVREVVLGYGGQLTFETPPAGGTRVRVQLPAGGETSAVAAVPGDG